MNVTSRDGTSIDIERTGEGPPVVLVTGGSVDRTSNAALAGELSRGFLVLNYDRRGRGASTDTPPYAVEREYEDLAAVIEAAGGSAPVFGSSSGAALVLHAAASAVPLTKLALWEPPFVLDESKRPPADQVERYEEMVAAGRRGDAVEYFMTRVIGMPPEMVAGMRAQPWWAAQESLAHTLAYDARIMGDYSLPAGAAARVEAPTLVIAGGADFPWMRETAQALAEALPNGRVHILEGQGHDVDPAALAPVLADFFSE
jgi:pimeloyl-ACP methyl ester carboxylesterase